MQRLTTLQVSFLLVAADCYCLRASHYPASYATRRGDARQTLGILAAFDQLPK